MEKETTAKLVFTPVNLDLFCAETVKDLTDSNLEFCQIRFRGFHQEIQKLVNYLNELDITDYQKDEIDECITELNFDQNHGYELQEHIAEIVAKFRTIKVTGLMENWNSGQVEVFFSESGFSVVTRWEEVGEFDGKQEWGDARWAYEYDMLKEFEDEFVDEKTGVRQRIYYKYPYEALWNDNKYILEENGIMGMYTLPQEQQFLMKDGRLVGYKGIGGEIVIPDEVTEIDANVFYENMTITSVTIPGTVEVIPEQAFYGCKNLVRVSLENGVEIIECCAFEDCSSLKDVVFPNTLTKIDLYAFSRCEMLDCSMLSFPSSLQYVHPEAFGGCINVPSVLYNADKTVLFMCRLADGETAFSVPNTVKRIGESAFVSSYLELETLELPSGLEEIGESAFSDCIQLKIEKLPDSVKKIGRMAFSSCSNLKLQTLPTSLETIEWEAFSHTGIEELTLPLSVKKIENEAFYHCYHLKKIHIPESIESIGKRAWSENRALTTIEISRGVKKIESRAFENCTSLKEITISGSVANIASELFYGCTSLEKVIIEHGTKKIGANAFAKCKNLKYIQIPETVGGKISPKLFHDSPDVVIYGVAGSNIEDYAKQNGIPFCELKKEIETIGK